MQKIPRKIELIIFDLDGTLIDAYRAVEQSLNYTMTRLGFPTLDAETIKRTVGWGDRHLVEKFSGKDRIAKAIVIYRRHHKDSLRKGTKLLPGARRILNYLKRRHYRLAVASNRPLRYSRIVLDILDIRKYFDYILCGDKIERPKPHPDILKLILKKFSLMPQQALYVGDMVIDIEAGKRAGIKTVAVLTGSSRKDEIVSCHPYKVVSQVYDVLKILAHLNNGRK